MPTEELIAYQRARAKGGVGLIIVQVVGVHETARYTAEVLMGTQDDCIPHFAACSMRFTPKGRRRSCSCFTLAANCCGEKAAWCRPRFSASVAPTERFRLVPRELTLDLIADIVEGYGAAARRLADAGADGVEVVASHGYLPAQFLNPKVNRREDHYGGSLSNRLRIFREAAASIRRHTSPALIVGLRISGDEFDLSGCNEEDTLAACRALETEFDYFNVIGGTSASAAGAVHIAPPMTLSPGLHGRLLGEAASQHRQTGLCRRPHQSTSGSGEAASGRPSGHVRHDPRDDLRSGDAQ